MTRLRDIANKVAYRAVQLMVESGYSLTFDQAQRKAARQIATIEKLKPRPVNTKKRSSSFGDGFSASDDPRRILLAKLAQMAARIGKQLTGKDAVQAPDPYLGSKNKEKRVSDPPIGSATGFKSQEEPQNSDTEPNLPYNYQFVYSGHSRVGVFDDNEFPARYRDPVTENWRRSLNQTPAQRQPSDDDLDVSSLQAICAAYDAQRKREKPDER